MLLRRWIRVGSCCFGLAWLLGAAGAWPQDILMEEAPLVVSGCRQDRL